MSASPFLTTGRNQVVGSPFASSTTTTSSGVPLVSPDQRQADLWGGYDATKAAGDQSIADFTKDYMAKLPELKGFNTSDTKAINDFYDGTVDKRLSDLEKQRSATTRSSVDRAIQAATRQNKLNRQGMGESSANDTAYASALGKITGDAAQMNADLARQDYLYGQDARRSLVGARGKLASDFLNTASMPYDFRSAILRSNLTNYGGTRSAAPIIPPTMFAPRGFPTYSPAPAAPAPTYPGLVGPVGAPGQKWSYLSNPYLGSWNTTSTPTHPQSAPWKYWASNDYMDTPAPALPPYSPTLGGGGGTAAANTGMASNDALRQAAMAAAYPASSPYPWDPAPMPGQVNYPY